MSDNGETSPGSCTHEEGEEWIVRGEEGEVGWLGGVKGVRPKHLRGGVSG